MRIKQEGFSANIEDQRPDGPNRTAKENRIKGDRWDRSPGPIGDMMIPNGTMTINRTPLVRPANSVNRAAKTNKIPGY